MPSALAEYLRSPALERSDAHIATLQSRLNYIAEVVEAVSQWSGDRARPVFALLNEIESDLLVIIGGESKDGREDSTYIMHSSWPADCSAAAMFESLPKRVVSVMNRGVGKVLLMDPEAEKWVVGWGSAMRDLASAFAGSANLEQSMGRLMALDIMLTNMLSFIASMRLNPMIEK
ncbi:hypothetical protein OR16_04757 [Cupriavidus basilensis OR16]|uniref:Uncharacterized protein n=2 Tax=Cupriavidus basilensis TaxID=68895 RepID=H1S043_9BURK|nr:hypothetical protein OR16_04757 [Cupriavidus basilensis OR16]